MKKIEQALIKDYGWIYNYKLIQEKQVEGEPIEHGAIFDKQCLVQGNKYYLLDHVTLIVFKD